MRACYRCLLWLHPPAFRREFAGEMLWIFDQTAASQGASGLLCDGAGSLFRQWLLRSGWWKVALALTLAMLQMTLGLMLPARRHIVRLVSDPAVGRFAEFSHYGAIAHQPLTVGMVMFLAVFVTGGLTIMVLGLTFWTKNFPRRRLMVHRVR